MNTDTWLSVERARLVEARERMNATIEAFDMVANYLQQVAEKGLGGAKSQPQTLSPEVERPARGENNRDSFNGPAPGGFWAAAIIEVIKLSGAAYAGDIWRAVQKAHNLPD